MVWLKPLTQPWNWPDLFLINTQQWPVYTCFISERSCINSICNHLLNNLDWKKIWNLPARYMINNNVKEVSFKIIHRIYPSKVFFYKVLKCYQYKLLFLYGMPWRCLSFVLVLPFFHQFLGRRNLISLSIDADFSLCFENILFGFTVFPSTKVRQYYIMNFIILLARCHIHKCRYTNQILFFLLLRMKSNNILKLLKNLIT